MKTLAKNLGLKIKEHRISKHLNQSELAEMIGIESKYLSRLETGASTPSLKMLKKLAEIFNIEISALFDFDYSQNKDIIIQKLQAKINSYSLKQLNMLFKLSDFVDTNY